MCLTVRGSNPGRGRVFPHPSKPALEPTHEDRKVISLTHRPPLPPKQPLVLASGTGWLDPRAIKFGEVTRKKFQWTNRENFFVFPCTLYFIRTCFFVLIVLHFAFCLYVLHTNTNIHATGGIFFVVLNPYLIYSNWCWILSFVFTVEHTKTSKPLAGFEPAIPGSERPEIHALNRAATVIRKESNPRPPVLWYGASTNCATARGRPKLCFAAAA